MQEHYDRIGIALDTPLADVKKAYRAKLKEFPAHSHPQEFKDIRASYEAIQAHIKSPDKTEDFFDLSPIEEKLDETAIAQIKQRAIETVEMSAKDLIALTF
ncbi:MAG: molecular chaperone DnaJ [Cyanothece sp. SIO2G6]|nr:molecular chaperone DnaJ [Cyanothece sp. SIO2G6]